MRKMRNAAIIAATLAAAIPVLLALAVLPKRLAFDGGDSYRFYLGDSSKNCRIVDAPRGRAALTRLTLSGVCGESATFRSIDMDGFLESVDGEIVFKEELSDSVNYYCRARLPYSVTLYGEEINLHVCVKESGVTVASPIIFGGY